MKTLAIIALILLLGIATSDALPIQVNILAGVILVAIMIIADRKANHSYLWERFPYGKRGW